MTKMTYSEERTWRGFIIGVVAMILAITAISAVISAICVSFGWTLILGVISILITPIIIMNIDDITFDVRFGDGFTTGCIATIAFALMILGIYHVIRGNYGWGCIFSFPGLVSSLVSGFLINHVMSN